MSFILDALRKSELERQQASVPGISQVPLATPHPQLPRWALLVIGTLAAAVLVLGGAWWQSSRVPVERSAATAPLVERSIELPPAAPPPVRAAPQQAVPTRPFTRTADAAPGASTLAAAAAASEAENDRGIPLAAPQAESPTLAARRLDLPADAPALPSATALAAEGVAVPALRLELHAFSGQPADRFVFINGRKYVEGDRLIEGPQLESIEPTGAVLSHAGRRFILVQE